MLERLTDQMRSRSAALLLTVDNGLNRILQGWLLIAGLLSAARIAFTPTTGPIASFSTVASYLLLVIAPFGSTILALRWFRNAEVEPQPRTRFARIGQWRSVARADAVHHPLYGSGGLMVSLLVGIMINVAIRAAEYLAAMPPMPDFAPSWLSVLHLAMTFDAVMFGSLYMVAFVAALRRSPIFPRLLAAIWIGDLLMQLITAKLVADVGGVPPAVALSLYHLLDNNVKKVLISIGLWLPYLLLSVRVNVTFRHRVPA
jgi:hypothetical protein